MTVTTPLTCDGFADALADYLERDDSPSHSRSAGTRRAAVETHAASCAGCGALLADLQQLRIAASGLPTLAPSRDLWAGVAERIATPVVELGAARGTSRPAAVGARVVRVHRARWAGAWVRSVAAAAALVVMTAGVTYYATREAMLQNAQVTVRPVDSTELDPRTAVADAMEAANQAAGIGTPEATLPRSTAGGAPVADRAPRTAARGASVPPRPTGPAAVSEVALASNQADAQTALETVYGREIMRLWRIVDQRRAQLDTATVGVIERNMTIIDRAIQESRAALAGDPASAFLNEQLNNVLGQKVELLRAAALLPVRS